MSFGKKKEKSQSSSSQALDPEIKAGLLGNVAQAQVTADAYQPYTGQRVADFSPTQTQAFGLMSDIATRGVGKGSLDSAIGGAKGLLDFAPQQVTAGQIADTDLSKYLNPYTQDVVDASLGDINRQREIALSQAKAQALKAGAWGGTGAGVFQGQVSDNFDRAGASTAATLRSQGFTNAQDAARSDIAARLSADQGNQGAGMAAGQLKLQSAGLLGDLSGQELTQATTRAGLLSNVGAAEQQQQQRVLDSAMQAYADYQNGKLSYQDMLNKTYGLLGNPTLTTSSGTSKGSGFNVGFPSGGGGGGAESAAAA